MKGLHDSLYNVYSTIKTMKKLWESLDRKYRIKDAGTKKFVVGQFIDYKMADSKTMIKGQEIWVILHKIHMKSMVLSETFQMATIIKNLLLEWNDFKNYLKHKWKEMSLEHLIG